MSPVFQDKAQHPVLVCGSLSVLVYGALVYYSNVTPLIEITPFLLIIACAFIFYSFVVYFYVKKNVQPSTFLILSFAIIFHVLGIIATPQFEDDYFRYLWDGYIFFEYGTPYALAPSDFFSDETIPYIYQNLLNQINYPDVKTIYSPLFQYSFWVSHWLFPADITGLKILFSFCNIGIILILLKMVDAKYVLLYAWNPLLIKEIAFTAHPDVVGVLFLMLAIFFISRRPKAAAIFLGISVCSKPFAWLIAIYFLWRFNIAQWALFLVSITLLYLPFALNGELFSGLLSFGNDWEFNAALYSLATLFFSANIAKGIMGLCMLGVMIYCYRLYQKDKPEKLRGDLLIGSLLLLSPILNPWYLVWLLPFATLHNAVWPWVMSFAVLLSYFSGINLLESTMGAYELASWVKPVEFSLIFMAIGYGFVLNTNKKVYTK